MDRLAPAKHHATRILRLSGRVQTLVIASALIAGVCLLATVGIAQAAPAEAAHAAIAAKSVAASAPVASAAAATDPTLQRIVAGGVTTLLFGTMISVVVVSWRSFRESVESDRARRRDQA